MLRFVFVGIPRQFEIFEIFDQTLTHAQRTPTILVTRSGQAMTHASGPLSYEYTTHDLSSYVSGCHFRATERLCAEGPLLHLRLGDNLTFSRG